MQFKFNYAKAKYSVSGVGNFSFSDALRLWRTKYDDIKDFRKAVVTSDGLKEMGEFVDSVWDDIKPVTVEEAFNKDNQEIRRTYFDCIGVITLFKSLEPELLDRQEIHKKRTRWDKDNQPYESEYDDVYELYKIDKKKLFGKLRNNDTGAVYAVKCWCTTTNREYWIYVPDGPAYGDNTDDGTSSWTWSKPANYVPSGKPDAISAIAWTIQIDVSNPKRIYRQGDIILVEENLDSQTVKPYHISKEQYLNLMYSET